MSEMTIFISPKGFSNQTGANANPHFIEVKDLSSFERALCEQARARLGLPSGPNVKEVFIDLFPEKGGQL